MGRYLPMKASPIDVIILQERETCVNGSCDNIDWVLRIAQDGIPAGRCRRASAMHGGWAS